MSVLDECINVDQWQYDTEWENVNCKDAQIQSVRVDVFF
jgi:hypothetical protein